MSTKTAVMTTREVADRLVSICRTGDFGKAINELYDKHVVSIEPEDAPSPQRVQGFDAVMNKTVEWGKGVEQVHSSKLSDPVVAGDHFAVALEVDVTMKGMGRINMDEICVYKVRDGKIVRDQFFYTAGQN